MNAPLFERVLGADFAKLAPRVRELHARAGTHVHRGVVSVRRGRTPWSRACAWAARLPAACDAAPIEVEIAADAAGERWTRRFGAHAMRSRLRLDRGRLGERLGLVRFAFALSVADGRLRWRVVEARVLGLPLRARWFAGVDAVESERDGRYRFEVAAALPLVGEIVRYEGWLEVADGR